MDQAYWLQRKRASVEKAHNATSARARLAHFELAGRYSVMAVDAAAPSELPAAIAEPEIDEAKLEALIPIFYQRVRDDALIGPVFDNAIADWDLHLGKLTDFWSSVMLTSGRYKGNPMAAHLKHLGEITVEMFDRWLALWVDVTNQQLAPPVAAALQDKAARIAESLKLALFFRIEPAPATPPAPASKISRKD